MVQALDFEVQANIGDLVGDQMVVEITSEQPLSRNLHRAAQLLTQAAEFMGTAYAVQNTQQGRDCLALLQAVAPEVTNPSFIEFRDLMKANAGQYGADRQKFMPDKPLSEMLPKDRSRIIHALTRILNTSETNAEVRMMVAEDFMDNPNNQPHKNDSGGLLINNGTKLPIEALEALASQAKEDEGGLIERDSFFATAGLTYLHPRSRLFASREDLINKVTFGNIGEGFTNSVNFTAIPYIQDRELRPLLIKAVNLIGRALKEVKQDGTQPGLEFYLRATMNDIATPGLDLASDRALLDNTGLLQVVIRDVESYSDRHAGVRQDFDANISVVRIKETERLKTLQGRVLELEERLPCDDNFKHTEAPKAGLILISDLIYSRGPSITQSMLLAHSLPNPDDIQAIGTKKNMFWNNIMTKYEHILVPIMEVMYGRDFVLEHDTGLREAFGMFVIGHEICHAFLKTEGIQIAFGDNYPLIEEPKADLGSIFSMPKFAEWNYLSEEGATMAQYVYTAGLLRSIRMSPTAAHGRGNMNQLRTMVENRGIEWYNGLPRNTEGFNEGVSISLGEICTIEGEIDSNAAKAKVAGYCSMTPQIETALNRLAHIPRDVVPKFTYFNQAF